MDKSSCDIVGNSSESEITLSLSSELLEKEYTRATVAASIDHDTGKLKSFFFGQMSSLYFFAPISNYKDVIKKLAIEDYTYLPIYTLNTIMANSIDYDLESKIKMNIWLTNKLKLTTEFVIDPKVIFIISNR